MVEGTSSSCWCFSEQLPAKQPLGLFSYQPSVGPCKMAACIFNNHWAFLCLKEYAHYLLNPVLVFLKNVSHREFLGAATLGGLKERLY